MSLDLAEPDLARLRKQLASPDAARSEPTPPPPVEQAPLPATYDPPTVEAPDGGKRPSPFLA